MSRTSNYKTWSQMNNDPDISKATRPGQKPKPKSSITTELKDINHLKFALKSHRFVIVKAEADWCEPCKALAPQYEELCRSSQNSKEFMFFTDDIDSETSPHVNRVTAVPTFFVYTDGDPEPKKTFTGDFDQLAELINRILLRLQQDPGKQAPPGSAPAHQPPGDGTANQSDGLQNPSRPIDFMPAPKYNGERPGYVFKAGDQGLGYYKDNGPMAGAGAPPAQ